MTSFRYPILSRPIVKLKFWGFKNHEWFIVKVLKEDVNIWIFPPICQQNLSKKGLGTGFSVIRSIWAGKKNQIFSTSNQIFTIIQTNF